MPTENFLKIKNGVISLNKRKMDDERKKEMNDRDFNEFYSEVS